MGRVRATISAMLELHRRCVVFCTESDDIWGVALMTAFQDASGYDSICAAYGDT